MELCNYPNVQKVRFYEIEAIELPIVYNKYGDHDPDGLMYVLKKDGKRVREKALAAFSQVPPQPCKEVQPLVIRANVGDVVKISFTHSLKRPLSIHVQGMKYDVQTSDGASVGYNKDSTTETQINYTWYADKEGVFSFQDMGDTRSGEEGTNVHGLFGAIIVEAAASVWLDPENGAELESGLFADIYHPVKQAFREYAVFFHDELEIRNRDGGQPLDPHTGLPSSTTAISYRAEPMRNRAPLTHDHSDTGEDISMSSWVYGDPAPPILRAYVGDPAKIRLIHGGIKETHVFHLHNHQWRLEPDNPNSTIIDSVSISPQECYTLDILHGAGSLNRTIGDVIFHCHLYPHFHEGMWTLWRIHDRLEDGTGTLPDGTIIPPLLPLKDRVRPPKKEEWHPGYPNFINGTFGEPPLQPPLGVLDAGGNIKTEPTELERANFVEGFEPGALYCDTCPCHADGACGCRMMSGCENEKCHEKDFCCENEKCHEKGSGCENEKCHEKDSCCKNEKCHEKESGCDNEKCHEKGSSCENVRCHEKEPCCDNVKVFEIAVIQAKVTYNRYGWHDPQGRFFVMKEELEKHGGLEKYVEKIENGMLQVQPLVIRANAGDCVEIRLTNLLPKFLEGSAFQMRTRTDIVGYHIHLVKFDTIVADGAANGWNNIAGARQYETLIERFFLNTELRTVFFHDHLFANSHQQHGVFGALLVEEAGATFHDVCTGEKINYGIQAVIKRRDGSSFREFELFVHDFALLFDKEGKPLNPPKVPGSHDDPGVMGINYRCEPMRERLKCREDPAYIFSSLVHGDPATPILETYPGEELMVRLLDGAHEEQHAFNLTGMHWKREVADPASPDVASQTLGISEAFNIHVTKQYGPGDYLYYFGGIDDVWLGLWGIIRVHDHQKKHLKPLCKSMGPMLPLPPCPGKNAVIRKYEVAAIQKDIQYNRHGDHDPGGLIFVPMEDADKVQQGKAAYRPLILRANAGDWIEVTLHNLLDPKEPVQYFDYPTVPLDMPHKPSMRVSMNPQFLHYDPIYDSGVNVGYNNREQTVGPGESKKYLWYADREYGACIIQSFGDLRNHRYHGLFGAVVIEPVGACWYRDCSPAKAMYEEEAVITAPGEESFRECVVMIQNGIRMLDKDGELVKTTQAGAEGHSDDSASVVEIAGMERCAAETAGIEMKESLDEKIAEAELPGAEVAEAEGTETEAPDPEDTGEKGYNYRSERFANRLKKDKRISKIFSSRIHGDPATPVFKAYAGERVIFRTIMPADKPRNVSFLIHGHCWKEQPEDPYSRVISEQGAFSIGNTFNLELMDGAGCPGDYLYRSGSLKWDVESGMWGIFRVLKRGVGAKCKDVCRKVIRHIGK